ncbi:ArsR family transcriptional regulator [Oleomonas cavernae]|uniref:ArsR family transcriptional regulator n=1 Tax=Oleomonas cavernae TaxID=2320859 RepID=UPI001314DBFE|nr:ArsR family transcriptional regulator [Oleomonas cavernae]
MNDLQRMVSTLWREGLRLCLLDLLWRLHGANDFMLVDLVAPYGFKATRGNIRAELSFLENGGMVRLDHLGDLVVVHPTERGCEVAAGLLVVHGIRRPEPRD